jgi:hypothetical protein
MILEKQAETFVLDFSKKAAKNCENQQCPFKNSVLIFRTFKKNINFMALSL